MIFGATYVNPMFNTVIAYDMGSNAQLLFGFNFTGIDKLTSAGIQLLATNLATWDSASVGGEILINEKVGYRIMRPLTVSLLMSQTFYGTSGKDARLYFTPAVAYKILPTLTASLSLEIGSDDLFKNTNMTITPCLEYALKGPALFYVQYELELVAMKEHNHRFGFGIDVKAF